MKKPMNRRGLCQPLLKFDLKMKLTTLLLMTTLFGLYANDSYAQKTKVTLNVKDATVRNVIDNIESSTDFRFIYKTKDVDLEHKISLRMSKEPIKKVLESLFGNTNTTYKIRGTHIILRKGPKKDPLPEANLKDVPIDREQDFTVTGTITDGNGMPLSGANIVEKGTVNGVTADFDGNFSLTIEDGNAILVVSYIGFATKEIVVNGNSSINISMKEDAASLEEVVIVGYGTQNKRAVTSAIATVSAEDLGENSSDSFTRSLSGKVAGVQVQQINGAPGGALKVRVRGTGSLTAGNDPLYVIDGFPVENSEIGNSDQGFNPLSSLNPDDIESIQVLKDAAASAIYGSRGANGVVIISTKRGKTGEPQFNFSTSVSTQSVHNKVDLLTGDQFLDFLRESWTNAAATTQPDVPMLSLLDNEDQYRGVNTDWQDEIFRTGIVKNYQLSASGGSDKFKYFISGGFLDEEGIVIESDFKRYSLRANLDAQLTDRLKLGVSLTPSYTVNNEVNAEGHWAGNGIILSALIAFPFLPPDASTEEFVNNQPDLLCCGTPNPSLIARDRDIKSTNLRLLANSYLEYEIIKSLKAKTSIGFDYSDFERNDFNPARTRRNNNNTDASSRKLGQLGWLSENTLNYHKFFGKSNLDVLAGFTYQEYRDQNNLIVASGLQNEAVRTITNAAFDRVTRAESVVNEWSLVSFLGRLNYSFDSKYLLSAAIRRDGSSRFGENNKYATFPSVSAGWVLSEENFLGKVENLSLLKLRASYGKTGNNRIGNYASLGLLQGGQNYVLGAGNGSNIGGLAPSSVANPDLTWETTTQYNLGAEIGILNNRIALTTDYFNSETEDLLLNVPIPASSGFTSALQNLGRIENKGWEFLLSTKNFTSDFKWNTDFNITFTKNKILELGPEGDAIRSGSGRGNLFLNEIGGELGAFNVFKQIGIFQTQDEVDNSATFPRPTFPGDVKYQDTNGDGMISDDDRVVVGSNRPDYIWGITNQFLYKNWDLSVVINGAHGGLVHSVQGAFTLGLQGFMNQYASTLGRWKSESEPGDGMTPRATFDTTGNNSLAETSRFVEDGSFTRIQNITIGYNFPSDVAQKLSLSSLRFFLSGNNLATFTDFQGYNPEASFAGGSALSAGADYGTYPLATRFTLGLKVGF
ncbi:TonB-dependent receptor [Zobellia galactanivorans]|uniref:TonB-dependent receptor n=1 Tax=Zobellia galactanivorans (strain DSM 12802 / CCUG 47099 / CIP 106680 / NCIMB 13871 / Dsij) TaxID=63186 RepID=UPI0026E37597|nr:TonB-dependent receptor [Zobellia galactanivorans]MDO6810468.1 TonB-dependent receptor [Zobellia galactanivorans]